jgi:hypothetical protein
VLGELLREDSYRERRARLRERLFAHTDGRAAERAVSCIEELAGLPKLSASPTLLDRAFPDGARVVRGRSLGLSRALEGFLTRLARPR